MTSPDFVSDTGVRLFELRRYLHGRMSAEERRDLEARLEADPASKERLEVLERERADFLERADVGLESARILQRLDASEDGAEARGSKTWLAGKGTWVAAAMCVLLAVPFAGPVLDSVVGPTSSNRTKGLGVGIEMFVKADGEIQKAEDGIELVAGDQIQFRYQAAGHGHLMIVSLDGRKSISPLFPAEPGSSLEVEPIGEHVLPGSIILDDAVGPERVFAIFSEEPLEFDEVREAIEQSLFAEGRDVRDIDRVELDRRDIEQVTIMFVKR